MTDPVLIAGAGPTGLNLALRLRRHGVPFRIIDRASEPGTQSRALAVHARTLEFYRQLGLADRVLAAGTRIESIRMREGGADVASAALADMGENLSPYPFVLDLPQDEHERLLVDVLAKEGVQVEWGIALEGVTEDEDGVGATLSGPHGPTRSRFAYVAGCDGVHSRVREAMGARFEGGTYERLYYVADVRARDLDSRELVLALEPSRFALRMPSRKGENERLIGFVPDGHEQDATFENVRESAERILGITVEAVNWFSTYRVHHRVADRFRAGRLFLLGDAGHVHSPVGGQGMNTGIGDAVNLGWKLAQVLAGDAPVSLLDTYENERIGFARQLVASTDQGFKAITDRGIVGGVMRGFVMPHLFPAATGLASTRNAIFRLISQIRIAYPKSALSEGKAGDVSGGDRLPWLPDQDNFAPLASLAWQAHVFGEVDPEFALACETLSLPVHRYDWNETARHAGFANKAAYLVRPDGHVALASPRQGARALENYANGHGMRFA